MGRHGASREERTLAALGNLLRQRSRVLHEIVIESGDALGRASRAPSSSQETTPPVEPPAAHIIAGKMLLQEQRRAARQAEKRALRREQLAAQLAERRNELQALQAAKAERAVERAALERKLVALNKEHTELFMLLKQVPLRAIDGTQLVCACMLTLMHSTHDHPLTQCRRRCFKRNGKAVRCLASLWHNPMRSSNHSTTSRLSS